MGAKPTEPPNTDHDQLRRSEARFRALIECGAEAVSLFTADGTVLYRTPSAAHMLGYTDEENLARGFAEHILEADRGIIPAALRRLFEGQERAVALSFRARHRDGSTLFMEGTITNLLDDPAVAALVGAFRDVTERRRADAERERLIASLEFERRRLGTLMQDAPAFMGLLRGKNHVFEFVNTAYLTLTGQTQVLGKTIAEVHPELGEQGFISIMDRVLHSGEVFVARGTPIMLAQPGGPPKLHYIDFVYQPVVEADGSRSGVFVHGVDVTEATMTQRRVRAQFHAVPVPTYVWQQVERSGQRTFALVDFNQAALTISQDRIAAHLGNVAEEVLEEVPRSIDDMVRSLEHGVTVQREIEGPAVAGKRRRFVVTCASSPPDLVIVHAADITERSALEAQLRQSTKMEAVGRLAGGVAHDFNNLLSVILSYSELALDDLDPEASLCADVRQIQEAGRRAAELTRQLLAFSRRQVLQPRVLDLCAVVSGMKSMLARLLGEDIELSIVTQPGTDLVLADSGQVEQVVMNLAVNARDAMPDGGKLLIEVGNCERHGEGYVRIATTDTGIGMDAETRSRVFEPFFTTKEAGKGSGLGLSTVFGIVEQSRGRVTVHSELGAGSTFNVYLPRCSGAVATAAPAPVAAPRGSETILLVEDELQVREVACVILRRHGYHVLDAASGEDAMQLSMHHPGDIHLLLTDVVMPSMNGRKVAESLAAHRPAMRVLYASGYTDDAIVRLGVLDDGVAFLQKPFTPAALLRKVREVLDAAPPLPLR